MTSAVLLPRNGPMAQCFSARTRHRAIEAIGSARTRTDNHPTAQGDGHHAGGDGCRSGDGRRPQGATGRKQSMTFVPRFRCIWVAAVGSSRVVPARPWSTLLIDRGCRRRPRRGAPDRRPVARPAAWNSGARPVVAEIPRAVGRGGRQLRTATPSWPNRYLELCERLDARGRLAEARRWSTKSVKRT